MRLDPARATGPCPCDWTLSVRLDPARATGPCLCDWTLSVRLDPARPQEAKPPWKSEVSRKIILQCICHPPHQPQQHKGRPDHRETISFCNFFVFGVQRPSEGPGPKGDDYYGHPEVGPEGSKKLLPRVLKGPPPSRQKMSSDIQFTLPSFKVERNPKTVIAISRRFSKISETCTRESNHLFKDFQMISTITPRTAKVGPRFYKSAPAQTRYAFRDGSVFIPSSRAGSAPAPIQDWPEEQARRDRAATGA